MAYAFENLSAWQEARKLVISVYQLLDDFPKFESYALCDQIRRSIVSVPSNLAEGSGRISTKEQLHFYEIAYGSLTESLCQLDIAHDLEYITDQEFDTEKERINTIGKQLSGLRSSFQKQL